jgi:two-component system, LytTR family, sensor kinase
MSAVSYPMQQVVPANPHRLRAWVGRYWRSALVLVGVWTFFALVFTPQAYLNDPRHRLTIGRAFIQNVVAFYLWIFLSPLILWIAGRYPLVRKRWLRNFAIQFLASIPIALGHVIAIRKLFLFFRLTPELAPLHLTVLFAGSFDLFTFWAIAAVGQGIRYYREYEEREYRLTQAQLQMLKGQLQPHFLFNTLNAVTELVYQSPEAADHVLTSLSDLLRLSLRQNSAETCLQDDLQFVYKYMDIQKQLLRERLNVEYHVDSGALNAGVPAMLLQPLVENAVKHGLAERASGGTVRISAQRQDEALVLSVSDDGAGADAPAGDSEGGIGLANTRARLAQLYPDASTFEAGAQPGGGFRVMIRIPYREFTES